MVSIIEYAKFEDAVAMVEDSPYGLQAGDLHQRYPQDRCRRWTGSTWAALMINDTSIFRVDHMPYGGNKISGIGREGVRFACEEMTSIRMVVIR